MNLPFSGVLVAVVAVLAIVVLCCLVVLIVIMVVFIKNKTATGKPLKSDE